MLLQNMRRLLYPISLAVLFVTTIATVGGQLASTRTAGAPKQSAPHVRIVPQSSSVLTPQPGHPGRYVLKHPTGAKTQTPSTPEHYVLRR